MALSRASLALVVVAATILLTLFGVWVSRGREPLVALPADERAGLYDRTMRNLTTLCTEHRAEDLKDFCIEQAKVARSLPECDARCRALTEQHLPKATR